MVRTSVSKENEHIDVLVDFTSLHFDPVNPRGEPEEDEEKIRALFGAEEETAVLATHMGTSQNPARRIWRSIQINDLQHRNVNFRGF